MKIKEIVNIYKILGEAKVTTLDESEIIKILKIRKELRSTVDAFEAFNNDVSEKFKPDNFNELITKINHWSELSDDEKVEINSIFKHYERKIKLVLAEELDKEVDIKIGKLNESTITKLLILNEWPINKVDDLSLIL